MLEANNLGYSDQRMLREAKGKKNEKNEDSLCELWDTIKRNNLHITGVQKEKKGRKEQKVYLKKQ